MKARLQTVAGILLFSVVYFATAKYGLSLAVVNPSASAIWPPTGIALAALLLWGYRLWPGIAIGAFVANITTQGTWLTSLGICTGNTLEALVGAYLVNQFANGRRAFEHPRDIFKFILLAVVVSTTVSATLGAFSLQLGGFISRQDFWLVWMTWWLGDAVGAIIVTPLIVLWRTVKFSRLSLRQWLETAAVWACVWLVCLSTFGGPIDDGSINRYLRFLLYPSVMWAAYRFGQRGAISSIFVVACVAFWGTLRNYGPFVAKDPNEALLLLQLYLGTFSATNLVLGALVSERQRNEDVLRESEDRFRTLTSHAPIGIFMSKPNGDSIYVNPTWCDMTGLTPSQSQGRDWVRALHPEDRKRVASGWDDAVAHKDSSSAEFRFVRPDGTVIWVHGQAVQLYDSTGELAGYIGTVADITERKLAELALRDSESRFRSMADSAPVLIWMAGPDKKCDYFNQPWLRFTGRTLEQELGDGWAEGVHPDDLQRCWETYVGAFDAHEEFEMEYRLRRHDGEYRWIMDHGVPRFEPGKVFVGYIGSCVDITERRQADLDLRQAKDELAKANEKLELRVLDRTTELIRANLELREEIQVRKQAELARSQLAAIVEDTSDAILSKNLEGIITSWNKGAEKLFGYSAEEMVGRPVSVILPPDTVDEMYKVLEQLRRDVPVEPIETMRMRKDGTQIPVSLTISPVKDEEGRITGVSAIMQDMSERKRLEAEILQVSEREQRRIAEDLHDGVGQQLGGISCLSDVLKKNLSAQGSPEAAAAAKISDLLTIAVAQTRNLARGLHPVAPEENGLMSALDDLATRVTDVFKVDCSLDCPRVVPVADNGVATHLYRIAQEGITNAIKHGRAAKIKVGLFSVPGRIILTVSDDGVGFEPDRSRSKGLGLRIMNHRASMIGGTLAIEAKPDGGTEVTCILQKTAAMPKPASEGQNNAQTNLHR